MLAHGILPVALDCGVIKECPLFLHSDDIAFLIMEHLMLGKIFVSNVGNQT